MATLRAGPKHRMELILQEIEKVLDEYGIAIIIYPGVESLGLRDNATGEEWYIHRDGGEASIELPRMLDEEHLYRPK
ncbi:MAG TPA: hypothetical protein PLK94_11575 [Alphaproteobacteria bacterium]|nr:hypothetical protein [Alphaproteobacteria bacterium]